jgi:hypothetical protein
VKKPRKQQKAPASPVCYLDSPEVDPAYVWAETDKVRSPRGAVVRSYFADSSGESQDCGRRAGLRATAME